MHGPDRTADFRQHRPGGRFRFQNGPMNAPPDETETFYDQVGGRATFAALIGGFFDEVRADPIVGPIYPADDWAGAETRLRLFYEQFWGGPHGYSESRGAPMLKMRHMSYTITPAVAQAWVGCMERAVDRLGLPDEAAEELRAYALRAAAYLINADEPS